jgi:hypothetical protein
MPARISRHLKCPIMSHNVPSGETCQQSSDKCPIRPGHPRAFAAPPKPFATRHSPSVPPSLRPSSRSPLSPQHSALSTQHYPNVAPDALDPIQSVRNPLPSRFLQFPHACWPVQHAFRCCIRCCTAPSSASPCISPYESVTCKSNASVLPPSSHLEAPRNVALMLMHVSASSRTPGSQSRQRRASWAVPIPRPEPPTPPPCSTCSPSSHLRRMLGCCSSNCKKKIAAF